jgi:hypothetical protein
MTYLPNPNTEQVALWLINGLTRKSLHDTEWQQVNKRFHGIVRAARPYIMANYKTPAEQEAAFDGLTLALAAIGHFDDISAIDCVWGSSTAVVPASSASDQGTS